MADIDLLKDIPGYRAILKSVLKSQIQLLLEQLSDQGGEESIILTASVTDGTLSHLGSSTGKGFLEGRDEVKSQFLGFCLKSYHKKQASQPDTATVQAPSSPPHFDTPTYKSPSIRPPRPGPYQRPSNSRNSTEGHSARPIRLIANPHTTNPLRPSLNQGSQDFISVPSTTTFSNITQDSDNTEEDIKLETTVVKLEQDEFVSDVSNNSTVQSQDNSEYGINSGSAETGSGSNNVRCRPGSSSSDQTEGLHLDPGQIKVEDVTQDEIDLEITGVEPGSVGWDYQETMQQMATDISEKEETSSTAINPKEEWERQDPVTKSQRKRKKKYDAAKMASAIEKVRGGMSKAKAARMFGVPRTTLLDKLAGRVPEGLARCGPQPILTQGEEKTLVNYACLLADIGYPLTRKELSFQVKRILDLDGRKTRFKDNLPGRGWFDAFKARNPGFSEKTPVTLGHQRSIISEEIITELRERQEKLRKREEAKLSYERKRKRCFYPAWQKSNDWLEFDEKRNLMFCTVCAKYEPNKTKPFVKGSDNFRVDSVRGHANSHAHVKFAKRYKLENPSPSSVSTTDENKTGVSDPSPQSSGSKEVSDPSPQSEGSKEVSDPSSKSDGSKEVSDPSIQSGDNNEVSDSNLQSGGSKEVSDPSPQSDGNKEVSDPSPQSNGNKEVSDPSPQSDGNKEVSDPSPQSDGNKEVSDPSPQSGAQAVVTPLDESALDRLNENEKEQLTACFNTAYFVARQKLPFSLYPSLLELQEKDGVHLPMSYRTDQACRRFITYIHDDLTQQAYTALKQSRVLSIMFDGASDVTLKENEIVYARVVEKGIPRNVFVKVNAVRQPKAEGVLEAINEAMNPVDPEWILRLVATGSDGARVNLGKKRSVAKLLKDHVPHLIAMHCICHKLQMGAIDAIKEKSGDLYKNLKLVLISLHKHSDSSTKTLKELKMLVDTLNDKMKKPVNLSGTGWMSHLSKCLDILLNNYTVFVQHFETIVKGQTVAVEVQDRAKLILKLLKDYTLLLYMYYLKDVLTVLGELSLQFQNDTCNPPEATAALETTSLKLVELQQNPGKNLQTFLDDVQENYTYKKIKLHPPTLTQDKLTAILNTLTDVVIEHVTQRVGDKESGALLKSMEIFYPVNLPEEETDIDTYGEESLTRLCEHYAGMLQRMGCDIDHLKQSEWPVLKSLMNKEGRDTTVSQFYNQMFTHPEHQETLKNILMLAEIVLCIPVSSAICEKGFSIMSKVKTEFRSNMDMNMLNILMATSIEGPDPKEYNPQRALDMWWNAGPRSKRPKFGDIA